MTTELILPDVPHNLWRDNIWDRLLDSLEEGTVIPILGSDLLQVEVDGTPVRLENYVARRLARIYHLPENDLPAERPLNHVVCQLIHMRKERSFICNDICQIMNEANFGTPVPLRQLAEITPFNLFVSTTFDMLMEKAIGEVRFGGSSAGVETLAYTPKKWDPLPAGKGKLPRPTVYHLMGKLSTLGRFVISDEDLLEHLCALQTERRPERLFDELKENNLLVLGVDYSDWLTRIFLRTAKGSPLSLTRDFVEILADSKSQNDHRLASFLFHFSSHTQVFRAGGAVEFVDDLWRRWRERHPGSAEPVNDLLREMPRNAIFISYTRADQDAALELKAGLEAAGLAVWFDNMNLEAGDSFNPRIEQYISKKCSCFVAVISNNTERRHEGFFRREWNLALERDRGIFDGRKFIVPVVVDNTAEPVAVPPRFEALHYTWLPGGRVNPAFVRSLRDIVGNA